MFTKLYCYSSPTKNYSHTYSHTPSTSHLSADRSHPHLMLLHIYSPIWVQPINRTHADITHQTTTISVPQYSNVDQQCKLTLIYHANDNHHNTKTTHINTTYRTQHTIHKSQNKLDQTNPSKPQNTTTSTHDMTTILHPIPQFFHKQINPKIMNFLIHHSNPSIQKKHH